MYYIQYKSKLFDRSFDLSYHELIDVRFEDT